MAYNTDLDSAIAAVHGAATDQERCAAIEALIRLAASRRSKGSRRRIVRKFFETFLFGKPAILDMSPVEPGWRQLPVSDELVERILQLFNLAPDLEWNAADKLFQQSFQPTFAIANTGRGMEYFREHLFGAAEWPSKFQCSPFHAIEGFPWRAVDDTWHNRVVRIALDRLKDEQVRVVYVGYQRGVIDFAARHYARHDDDSSIPSEVLTPILERAEALARGNKRYRQLIDEAIQHRTERRERVAQGKAILEKVRAWCTDASFVLNSAEDEGRCESAIASLRTLAGAGLLADQDREFLRTLEAAAEAYRAQREHRRVVGIHRATIEQFKNEIGPRGPTHIETNDDELDHRCLMAEIALNELKRHGEELSSEDLELHCSITAARKDHHQRRIEYEQRLREEERQTEAARENLKRRLASWERRIETRGSRIIGVFNGVFGMEITQDVVLSAEGGSLATIRSGIERACSSSFGCAMALVPNEHPTITVDLGCTVTEARSTYRSLNFLIWHELAHLVRPRVVHAVIRSIPPPPGGWVPQSRAVAYEVALDAIAMRLAEALYVHPDAGRHIARAELRRDVARRSLLEVVKLIVRHRGAPPADAPTQILFARLLAELASEYATHADRDADRLIKLLEGALRDFTAASYRETFGRIYCSALTLDVLTLPLQPQPVPSRDA